MSASALLLVIPTSPRYPNTSTQTASIASQAADATASQTPAAQPPLVAASDASDTSEAHHPEPLVVKEDAAPTPDRDSWEATASPAQMRPVTAPDVLDEVPVAQAKPVRAAAAVPTPAAGPAPKLAANPVASPVAKVALTPVAKAAPKLAGRSVATALVRRARVITARQVRHARAYAAARAAKLWTTKKRQYGWRHSTRRRYASY